LHTHTRSHFCPIAAPLNGDCPQPWVRQATCASDLRGLCNATSEVQSRALLYGFSPGSCTGTDPAHLTDLEQDVANFLLVRGGYAWLGNGWLGCSRQCQCGRVGARGSTSPSERATHFSLPAPHARAASPPPLHPLFLPADEYPAKQFDADYGEPSGVCSETAPGSGVFVRDFSKSTVQMDCATWTPTITFK